MVSPDRGSSSSSQGHILIKLGPTGHPLLGVFLIINIILEHWFLGPLLLMSEAYRDTGCRFSSLPATESTKRRVVCSSASFSPSIFVVTTRSPFQVRAVRSKLQSDGTMSARQTKLVS